MNTYSLAGIFLCVVVAVQAASKTTFIPRQISTNQTFELANLNYLFHTQHGETRSLFAVRPFFQRSVQGKKNASFFLVNNKSCITLQEDGTGDVDSLWFNLIAASGHDYQSTVSIRPQRRTAGALFTLYTYLPFIADNFWVGLNTAVVQASHRLHFKECPSVYPGTIAGFANSFQALTNPAWSAGRFYGNSLKTTGLDDIQVKCGYDVVHNDLSWAAPYLIGTIGTGKKVTSCHIFEPLVGSRHGSFGVGFNGTVTWQLCNDNSLSWMVDTNYRYVFAARERRSFDLHNGAWSRYLQVATADEPLDAMPGINYFTRTVSVTPGSTIQFWTALHYQRCAWDIEVSYNLWFRAHEKIKKLSCNNSLCVGVFDMAGVCNPPPTSASNATIAQGIVGDNLVVADGVFTPVTLGNFALCSAENNAAITNTVCVSAAHTWSCAHHGWVVGLNGSYEFSNRNNALHQVACWFDCGLLF